MKVKEKQLTARQNHILDCTMALLRKNGMAGLTVRKVAGSVGFSEAALYRHYPSKEALLVGLLERVEEKLLSRLRELAGDTTRPVELRIEDCLRHHVSIVLEAEGLPILLLSEGSAQGDLFARQVRRILRGYLAIMEPLLEQIPQSAGSDLSTRERLIMLMGLPAITAVLTRALPSSFSRPRMKNEVVHVFASRILATQRPEDDLFR